MLKPADLKNLELNSLLFPFLPFIILSLFVLLTVTACGREEDPVPVLTWYVFDEPSGAFATAARSCSDRSQGAYRIEIALLPTDADQQREQLVRRLAARDQDIDIIGMDVIWTPEFAEAGWVLPWPRDMAAKARQGRLEASVTSATYEDRLQAIPFTTNTQLLWYRTDRVDIPPRTWAEMLRQAEKLGEQGTIQAQGERYEGLTVFFTSLLASAGGSVLEGDGQAIALPRQATLRALQVMKELATSPAADPSLATSREDQARLAFEAGDSTFMVNYTFVWPSARRNAPDVARHMGWARWPRVREDLPSRVTVGGLNLGVGAYSRHPDLAFEAALCLASEENQKIAASRGGLPPTISALYQDEAVRRTFPFADTLLATLRDGVQRPRTPLYNDISLAISRTLHPMRSIEPATDYERLHNAIGRGLRSEGLL